MRIIRHLLRLFVIARTFARNDADFIFKRLEILRPVFFIAGLFARRNRDGRPGERVARTLNELGPSFIKLGQILSTRADLFGEAFTQDLASLQDRVPPFPAEQAKQAIEAAFEEPMDALFRSFDETPVAAASIAQVHFAETKDGHEVAVKVLRPGIEEAFQRDLELLSWAAGLVEDTQRQFRRFKPRDVVETLADTVNWEMNLRMEAAAASELRDNFAEREGFYVPAVDWDRTGQRVLTTERVVGIRVDKREELIKAGHDVDEIIRKAAEAFFRQVFVDGFFHADLHPGNLFVREDGVIMAVDFGIMGRIDERTQRFLAEMLLGFLTRDYDRVAKIHFEAGYVPANQDMHQFAQACRSFAEPILGRPQNEISIARLLGQLFQVTERFQMEVQPQLLLLQKTMLMVEGIGRTLNPEVNTWLLAEPLIADWGRKNLGVQAQVRMRMEEGIELLQRLPAIVEKLDRELDRRASEAEHDKRPPVILKAPTGIWYWIWPGVALVAALTALFLALR